jgi:hypothetical protein
MNGVLICDSGTLPQKDASRANLDAKIATSGQRLCTRAPEHNANSAMQRLMP